ncbi:MAG: FIST C-terminal domain-containing protein [Verrucomicrobiota bacterium]
MTDNSAASHIELTTYDEERVREAVEQCRERLGSDPDCVFCFVSSDWKRHVDDLVEVIQVHGRAGLVVGCSADGLIGTGEENESVSGLSMLFLNLPGTKVRCRVIDEGDVGEGVTSDYWHRVTGVKEDEEGDWIVLGNPALLSAEKWLMSWNASYPDSQCFGGLASGGGEEDLFLFSTEGSGTPAALAVHFSGGVRLQGVVSQGCRPIGEPYTITSVDDNYVVEIASQRAFDVLEEAFNSLEAEEQAGARGNIFAGIAMSEYVEEFGRGDFLVRNIIGGDPDAGVLALGTFPRVGQTLQFQLRDKDTADEDLRRACEEAQAAHGEPFGLLLFSCTGRGVRMFGVPNHDAGVMEDVFGKVSLAGFFCNGEIGPVGNQNFLHGYTAAGVMFC